jgi:nucleotide-binding universal stress UspA family protein
MESSETREARPFRVVAGVDFSPMSGGVLRRALEIAGLGPTAEVHVVAVAEYQGAMLGLDGLAPGQIPSDTAARLQELTKQVVGEMSADQALRVQRVVTHLLTGAPAQEIVWLAAHVDADLIVVGTHGRRGVSRLFLGSVAERVVRTAGCPVYIVRDKHHDSAWRVPEIEPPCPDCLAVRTESGGQRLWCERHEGHIHNHVYSGANDSALSPTRAWGFSP